MKRDVVPDDSTSIHLEPVVREDGVQINLTCHPKQKIYQMKIDRSGNASGK